MNAQRAAQLVEAGLWLQMSGDVEGARRLFEQALKVDPTHARARELIAGNVQGARPASLESAPPPPRTPWAPPPPPERQPLMELDWAGATGFDAPPEPVRSSPPVPEPVPQPQPPELDVSWGDHTTLQMFQAPPAVPPVAQAPATDYEIPIAADFDDPDAVPAELPKIRAVTYESDATSAWDSKSDPGLMISPAKPGLGDVMDMVVEPDQTVELPSRATAGGAKDEEEDQRGEVEILLRGARDLLELDDHSGAMELILKAQQMAPADPQVIELKERSEQTLQAMYESKLGPMGERPRVLLKDDEIIWLNLDHRAGFVLAQIDGLVSFEDLFEVCGMSRLDTARILAQLVDEGVIGTR